MQRLTPGFLFILTVPLCAGLATPRGLSIGGFNYTGWLWLLYLLGGGLLVLADKAFRREASRVGFWCLPWLAFSGLVWASIAWAPSPDRRNVQDALQIGMPWLMAVAASLFVRREGQWRGFVAAFGLALVPLAASVAAFRLEIAEKWNLTDGMRPLGLCTALASCVLLSAFPRRKVAPLVGWAVCLAVLFFSGGRTVTALLLVVPLVHPLMRGMVWRVVLMGIVLSTALLLFQTRAAQERFFYSGRGTVSDLLEGDIRDSGRFDAWEAVAREVADRPLLGHGVGTAYDFIPQVWPGMNHVHNDYLRIAYECGLLGLTVFLLASAALLAGLIRGLRETSGAAREAFAAAMMGLTVFLLAALTGNPLPSNVWFMNPLFAVMGAAYGLADAAASGETQRL